MTALFLERIPDLIFSTLGGRYMAFGLHEFASNKVMAPSPWFSGSHSPEGILIMTGDPCESKKELKSASIEDIAPTVLHLMGFKIPKDMDGRVMEEAFKESFLKKNGVEFSGPWDEDKSDSQGLAPEEESAVRRQLEGLGYL